MELSVPHKMKNIKEKKKLALAPEKDQEKKKNLKLNHF